MASRKQEIRKEIKKKNAKLGIDVEAAKNIVDLQDQQGEDIHVEAFTAYKEGLKKKIVKANEDLKEVKYEYKVN